MLKSKQSCTHVNMRASFLKSLWCFILVMYTINVWCFVVCDTEYDKKWHFQKRNHPYKNGEESLGDYDFPEIKVPIDFSTEEKPFPYSLNKIKEPADLSTGTENLPFDLDLFSQRLDLKTDKLPLHSAPLKQPQNLDIDKLQLYLNSLKEPLDLETDSLPFDLTKAEGEGLQEQLRIEFGNKDFTLYGKWSEWTLCTALCGDGLQRRQRLCMAFPQKKCNNAKMEETKTCFDNTFCILLKKSEGKESETFPPDSKTTQIRISDLNDETGHRGHSIKISHLPSADFPDLNQLKTLEPLDFKPRKIHTPTAMELITGLDKLSVEKAKDKKNKENSHPLQQLSLQHGADLIVDVSKSKRSAKRSPGARKNDIDVDIFTDKHKKTLATIRQGDALNYIAVGDDFRGNAKPLTPNRLEFDQNRNKGKLNYNAFDVVDGENDIDLNSYGSSVDDNTEYLPNQDMPVFEIKPIKFKNENFLKGGSVSNKEMLREAGQENSHKVSDQKNLNADESSKSNDHIRFNKVVQKKNNLYRAKFDKGEASKGSYDTQIQSGQALNQKLNRESPFSPQLQKVKSVYNLVPVSTQSQKAKSHHNLAPISPQLYTVKTLHNSNSESDLKEDDSNVVSPYYINNKGDIRYLVANAKNPLARGIKQISLSNDKVNNYQHKNTESLGFDIRNQMLSSKNPSQIINNIVPHNSAFNKLTRIDFLQKGVNYPASNGDEGSRRIDTSKVNQAYTDKLRTVNTNADLQNGNVNMGSFIQNGNNRGYVKAQNNIFSPGNNNARYNNKNKKELLNDNVGNGIQNSKNKNGIYSSLLQAGNNDVIGQNNFVPNYPSQIQKLHDYQNKGNGILQQHFNSINSDNLPTGDVNLKNDYDLVLSKNIKNHPKNVVQSQKNVQSMHPVDNSNDYFSQTVYEVYNKPMEPTNEKIASEPVKGFTGPATNNAEMPNRLSSDQVEKINEHEIPDSDTNSDSKLTNEMAEMEALDDTIQQEKDALSKLMKEDTEKQPHINSLTSELNDRVHIPNPLNMLNYRTDEKNARISTLNKVRQSNSFGYDDANSLNAYSDYSNPPDWLGDKAYLSDVIKNDAHISNRFRQPTNRLTHKKYSANSLRKAKAPIHTLKNDASQSKGFINYGDTQDMDFENVESYIPNSNKVIGKAKTKKNKKYKKQRFGSNTGYNQGQPDEDESEVRIGHNEMNYEKPRQYLMRPGHRKHFHQHKVEAQKMLNQQDVDNPETSIENTDPESQPGVLQNVASAFKNAVYAGYNAAKNLAIGQPNSDYHDVNAGEFGNTVDTEWPRKELNKPHYKKHRHKKIKKKHHKHKFRTSKLAKTDKGEEGEVKGSSSEQSDDSSTVPTQQKFDENKDSVLPSIFTNDQTGASTNQTKETDESKNNEEIAIRMGEKLNTSSSKNDTIQEMGNSTGKNSSYKTFSSHRVYPEKGNEVTNHIGNSWSDCSVSCGKGVRSRVALNDLGYALHEIESCFLESCSSAQRGKMMTVDEGGYIQLHCALNEDSKVKWADPKGNIIHSDAKHQMADKDLYIIHAQNSDKGVYHCMVLDENGQMLTADANLDVRSCKSQNACNDNGQCIEIGYSDKQQYDHFICKCYYGFRGQYCQLGMFSVSKSTGAFATVIGIILAVFLCIFCAGASFSWYKRRHRKQQIDGKKPKPGKPGDKPKPGEKPKTLKLRKPKPKPESFPLSTDASSDTSAISSDGKTDDKSSASSSKSDASDSKSDTASSDTSAISSDGKTDDKSSATSETSESKSETDESKLNKTVKFSRKVNDFSSDSSDKKPHSKKSKSKKKEEESHKSKKKDKKHPPPAHNFLIVPPKKSKDGKPDKKDKKSKNEKLPPPLPIVISEDESEKPKKPKKERKPPPLKLDGEEEKSNKSKKKEVKSSSPKKKKSEKAEKDESKSTTESSSGWSDYLPDTSALGQYMPNPTGWGQYMPNPSGWGQYLPSTNPFNSTTGPSDPALLKHLTKNDTRDEEAANQSQSSPQTQSSGMEEQYVQIYNPAYRSDYYTYPHSRDHSHHKRRPVYVNTMENKRDKSPYRIPKLNSRLRPRSSQDYNEFEYPSRHNFPSSHEFVAQDDHPRRHYSRNSTSGHLEGRPHHQSSKMRDFPRSVKNEVYFAPPTMKNQGRYRSKMDVRHQQPCVPDYHYCVDRSRYNNRANNNIENQQYCSKQVPNDSCEDKRCGDTEQASYENKQVGQEVSGDSHNEKPKQSSYHINEDYAKYIKNQQSCQDVAGEQRELKRSSEHIRSQPHGRWSYDNIDDSQKHAGKIQNGCQSDSQICSNVEQTLENLVPQQNQVQHNDIYYGNHSYNDKTQNKPQSEERDKAVHLDVKSPPPHLQLQKELNNLMQKSPKLSQQYEQHIAQEREQHNAEERRKIDYQVCNNQEQKDIPPRQLSYVKSGEILYHKPSLHQNSVTVSQEFPNDVANPKVVKANLHNSSFNLKEYHDKSEENQLVQIRTGEQEPKNSSSYDRVLQSNTQDMCIGRSEYFYGGNQQQSSHQLSVYDKSLSNSADQYNPDVDLNHIGRFYEKNEKKQTFSDKVSAIPTQENAPRLLNKLFPSNAKILESEGSEFIVNEAAKRGFDSNVTISFNNNNIKEEESESDSRLFLNENESVVFELGRAVGPQLGQPEKVTSDLRHHCQRKLQCRLKADSFTSGISSLEVCHNEIKRCQDKNMSNANLTEVDLTPLLPLNSSDSDDNFLLTMDETEDKTCTIRLKKNGSNDEELLKGTDGHIRSSFEKTEVCNAKRKQEETLEQLRNLIVKHKNTMKLRDERNQSNSNVHVNVAPLINIDSSESEEEMKDGSLCQVERKSGQMQITGKEPATGDQKRENEIMRLSDLIEDAVSTTASDSCLAQDTIVFSDVEEAMNSIKSWVPRKHVSVHSHSSLLEEINLDNLHPWSNVSKNMANKTVTFLNLSPRQEVQIASNKINSEIAQIHAAIFGDD